MITKHFSQAVLMLVFLSITVRSAASEEQLDFKDIHRVMNEILGQHVDKNKMSTDVIKSSMEHYINEFDPLRIYLLEKEVKEATDLNSGTLTADLNMYDKDDFSDYVDLNNVIQNSIKRARNLRAELTQNSDNLFQKSAARSSEDWDADDSAKQPFPKNVEELKHRIENGMLAFINLERVQYGANAVMQNKEKTLMNYDKLLRHKENQYLFEDERGSPLPAAEKQNLLVMHILKALSKSLDSHTAFLNSEEAYDMKIRLEKGFHGIGVILNQKPEGIVVSRLIKDGPAEKSKLVKVNDRVLKINGEDVDGYTLEELVNKLRDENHQTVYLVLKRTTKEGSSVSEKTIPVTLKREFIAVDEGRVDVAKEPFQNGLIGIITLHAFYQGENGVTSEKDMRKAINDLKKEGNLKGIVLDLRENSGGFLNQAVKVAGLFITSGVVVVSKYSNGEEHFYRDMDGKVSFDGPLVILTSKATASAAEIVAQSLQDYGVAIIVGDDHTYGKGTIQSQTVTDGKSATHFKVTVGKYYTVSGKTPQVHGVLADIVVPSHYSREHIGEEYLQHPLASDTIPPSYKDDLVDIDPGLKPWYLRYYMPTLQVKETNWIDMIPSLKKKSKERMEENQGYKLALNEEGASYGSSPSNPEGKDLVPDYQLKEAVNILKDMIQLEEKYPQAKAAGSY